MNIAVRSAQALLTHRAAISVAITGALGALAIVWHHGQSVRELAALPAQERTALYERTLVTLRTTCARARGEAFNEYCQQQATFLLRFPECDASCSRTCQSYFPRPTR